MGMGEESARMYRHFICSYRRVVGSRVAKSMSAVKTPALVKLFSKVLLPAFV